MKINIVSVLNMYHRTNLGFSCKLVKVTQEVQDHIPPIDESMYTQIMWTGLVHSKQQGITRQY